MKRSIHVLFTLALVVCSLSARAITDVAIQLRGYHQAQFAGYYVALENGAYEDEGLNVRLIEGTPGIDKIDLLVAGSVDFVVDSPENLLVHRQYGDDVVAVAVLYQRNPLVFITKSESNLVRPHDFIGRSAAILSADRSELQFLAMLKRLELDASQVMLLPYDDEHNAFYDGSADITLSTINGGLIRIRRSGHNVNIIWPGDYGVRMYSDALITTRRMITDHPDLVAQTVRATLAGWDQAIFRPERAVDIILRFAREADRELQREMMLASIPLVAVGATPIGWMEPDIWSSMIHILMDYGVLDRALNPSDAFDRTFVELAQTGAASR